MNSEKRKMTSSEEEMPKVNLESLNNAVSEVKIENNKEASEHSQGEWKATTESMAQALENILTGRYEKSSEMELSLYPVETINSMMPENWNKLIDEVKRLRELNESRKALEKATE